MIIILSIVAEVLFVEGKMRPMELLNEVTTGLYNFFKAVVFPVFGNRFGSRGRTKCWGNSRRG